MSRTKGTYTLTSNIEPKVGAPLDARTIVKLLADLTANNTFEYPYKGMRVFVEENNKSYTLVGSDPTVSTNWIEDNSGGHTIKNPSGTAMTQRSNLQFVDLTVSDDSTNDVTKVENIHVIQSESELTNLPDGLYMLDDDEGTVIDSNLVGYDNTDSELNAENVQDAIDEIIGSLGTAATKDIPATGNAGLTEVVMGNDTRLSDARTPVSHTHTTSDISDFPTMSDYIQKSDTTGFVKNDGSIDTNTYLNSTLKGTANGVAELDENGKVPSAQLPSYVDDVLEYASVSAFPATGESGKIYIALDINKTYRWGGSEYVEISESLALGETSSTAYRGDRGKTAYDHSQLISGNPHKVSKSDVGLGNVDNTSDSTKKTNFTGSIASGNTGFTTGGDVYTALGGKADKVSGATDGHIAGLDANGNLTDSGLAATTIVHKADKVSGQVAGHLASLSGTGNLTDSGVAASEIPALWDEVASKSNVQASTTNGNIKIDNVETPVYRNYANNTVLTTDKTPYLNRQCLTPTGFSSYVREKLIGCSVAWNQLVATESKDYKNTSITDTRTYINLYIQSVNSPAVVLSNTYITTTGIYAILFKSEQDLGSGILIKHNGAIRNITFYQNNNDSMYKNHVYLFIAKVDGCDPTTANGIDIKNMQITDLTIDFSSDVANHLYNLANNGGIDWLRNHNYPIDQYTQYGYGLYSSKPSAKKVVGKNKNDNSNNVTGGYYESNGTWQASNDYATSGLIPVLPNTTYVGSMFDKNGNNRDSVVYTLWSDSTTCQGGYTTSTITTLSDTKFVRIRNYQRSASYITAKNFVFQLEIGSTNTAYEPYSFTTYSLGSTELRGHLIVQNGEIVAEGDVRESNGNTTRYWTEIDLGALAWVYDTTNLQFYSETISNIKANGWNYNVLCSKYAVDSGDSITSPYPHMRGVHGSGGTVRAYIVDPNYTDGSTLKTSLNGVYALCELATPTTETSTPFADPMSLNGCTTEEYVDDRTIPVPVGHETQYMGQSEDVVEIPSMPLADGKRVLTNYTSGGESQMVWEDIGILTITHKFANTGSVAVGGYKYMQESIADEVPSGYKCIGAFPSYAGDDNFVFGQCTVSGNMVYLGIRNVGSGADSGIPQVVLLCVK